MIVFVVLRLGFCQRIAIFVGKNLKTGFDVDILLGNEVEVFVGPADGALAGYEFHLQVFCLGVRIKLVFFLVLGFDDKIAIDAFSCAVVFVYHHIDAVARPSVGDITDEGVGGDSFIFIFLTAGKEQGGGDE